MPELPIPASPAAASTRFPAWLSELLTEDGTPVNGVLTFAGDEDYVGNFGREWTWFARTQLDDAAVGRTETTEAFFQKTGWRPDALRGALVLDAGCGMGRFAQVAAEHGARVVAVDLSDGVFSARRNLEGYDDVAVLRADLRSLPLRHEAFDLVYSLGVLHHTPDTRESFATLVPHVRPGGEVAVWVYSGEPDALHAHRVSDSLRRWTSRMDHGRLLRLCRLVSPLGRLYRTRAGSRLYRCLPVSRHANREWRILDTFDWYSPAFQWKHTWAEVEGWFADAGLVDVRRNPFEVAVAGRRPS